jgi:hypothetical protein
MRTVAGYLVAWIMLPIWLVLHVTAWFITWATCILPLPFAWAIGRGDDFSAWSDRFSDRLFELAAAPLALATWIGGEDF